MPGAGETRTRSRRAEEERLPRSRLVDHLFVELAYTPTALNEVHAEEAAIGDRAGVRDREAPGSLPPSDEPADAIPDHARPQFCEFLGRVAAGQHVEHVLQLLSGEVSERIGAAGQLVQLVDRHLLVGRDRDDLLGEHVERVPRHTGLLDRALAHPAHDHRRLQQVGTELREDAALRRLVEPVAGASYPLEAARDGFRRFDLDHEVDGAHVDSELERRRGDQRRDLPPLEELLDLDALFAREGAVVGACDLSLGELVETEGEPLGQPAIVDEENGRAMLLDETQELRVDRRPDRIALPGLAHVVDRNDDAKVELFGPPGVDQLDLASAGNEPADLVERPLRRRKTDPLERLHSQAFQPLEAQREMRAPLRSGDGVHLVHDHEANRPQRLPRA